MMRVNEVGLYNSFEDVERCELRQLDGAFVDEMNGRTSDTFFEDCTFDGLAAAAWDDGSLF